MATPHCTPDDGQVFTTEETEAQRLHVQGRRGSQRQSQGWNPAVLSRLGCFLASPAELPPPPRKILLRLDPWEGTCLPAPDLHLLAPMSSEQSSEHTYSARGQSREH